MKKPEDMKKPFEEKHFEDVDLMIDFYDYFEDAEILAETINDIDYKYLELYCKNPNCDCTEITLEIYQDDNFLGNARYDYKLQRLTTQLNHLINLDTLIEFSKFFEIKHEFVKSIFEDESMNREIAAITTEIKGYKKEIKSYKEDIKGYKEEVRHYDKEIKHLKSNKIGRNQPCPCGSGKKYKRCCLAK
jgi:hypothetical protein